MTKPGDKLANPPIVEAVVDLDCAMPAEFDLKDKKEAATRVFRANYPTLKHRFLHEHEIEAAPGTTRHTARHRLQALQFASKDEKQLVQVRDQGFSFNRLAPYTTLDDYIGEIERLWSLFTKLTSPEDVRIVRLRYINRIMLPGPLSKLKLDDYVQLSTRLTDDSLQPVGFLHRYDAKEPGTGNDVRVILASQQETNDGVPVILDNSVGTAVRAEPDDWTLILDKIQSLRVTKNRVFWNTLTEKCIQRFQPQA
jgi:uncharacterized protein (TIGR04255 family)